MLKSLDESLIMKDTPPPKKQQVTKGATCALGCGSHHHTQYCLVLVANSHGHCSLASLGPCGIFNAQPHIQTPEVLPRNDG